ncbi:MAG: hypothetical protein ACPIOQ_70660, partial [Promethearchaeia archaeon]
HDVMEGKRPRLHPADENTSKAGETRNRPGAGERDRVSLAEEIATECPHSAPAQGRAAALSTLQS